MADLQFEDENNSYTYKSRVILGQGESPKMVLSLVKWGLVKNERQAGNILLTMSICFLVATALIIYSNFTRYSPAQSSSKVDKYLQSYEEGGVYVNQQ